MKIRKLGRGYFLYLHNLDFHIQLDRIGSKGYLEAPSATEINEIRLEAERSFGEKFKIHVIGGDCSIDDDTQRMHLENTEHGCSCPPPPSGIAKGKKEKE